MSAERLLTRVIRAADADGGSDETLRFLAGRARITLARSLYDRGREEDAFALLRRAEHDAGGPRAAEIRTLVAVQAASLHGRSGDWRTAVRLLEGIDLDGDGVSARAANVIRLNLGMAHQYLGNTIESERRLNDARAGAAAVDHLDLEFMAIHNLGRLAFVLGQVPRALALMGEADALPVDVERVTARCDRSRVLLEAGLLDEADTQLTLAESEARRNGLVHELAELTLERSRMKLLRGDYGGARQAAAESARLFGRQGATAWQTQARLLRLEADLAAGHRLRSVAREARALADGPARSAGVGTEAAMLTAEALALSGDADEAARRLAGLGGPRGLSFTNRLHLALTRATVTRAAGDLRQARQVLRRAAVCLADEQARYAGLDNRTALALHGRRLAGIDLDLALQSGTPAAVFAATERWRGTSNRLAPVSPSGDAVLDALLADLRRARIELRDADNERRPALVREIAHLERTAAHRDWATASAEEPAGTARSPHTAGAPVTYPALRAALRDTDTGLVAFVVHDGRLHAVTVETERSAVLDLAPEDVVVELVQRVTADLRTLGRVGIPALRQAVERSLTTSTARLDEILAAAYPRSAGRVVVLPSRLLASMPWRMLPGLDGRPLVVSPSATFWVNGGRYAATDASRTDGVAAIAGPDLARAAEEARAVARTWRTPAMTDREADGSALASALRDRRIVHIAAHGVHHDQSPLFSHVLLADGPIFAHEFQRVGVGADHVVLSACEVGRAHIRHGEEALGLTASLLASGVRSVVASVASVRDEQAEQVMTAYHRELARGTDAALALERAAAGIPDGRHFCAYGADWSPARVLR